MNDSVYTKICEETDPGIVNSLIYGGWMILRIYLRKREVRYSDPREFEEYPVYILGYQQDP